MASSIESFRRRSLKKFEELPAESSEAFRKQTGFRDFGRPESGKPGDGSVSVKSKPDGVKVTDLGVLKSADVLSRFDVDDKFVQMNNAFFRHGLLIEVPRGRVAGTMRLVSSPASDSFGKMVVVMGEGSGMDLVKESYSPNADASTISEDVLVLSGPGSSLTFSEVQNYNRASSCFSNKIAVCGRDARVGWNLGVFGGGRTRTRTYNFMEGDGSHVEDLQLTFGDGEQQFDAFSNLVHAGRGTSAKALAKGAFRDRAQSVFKGMIKIREGAKGASSYLACHGMLLGRNARSSAVPSLEIETDDVKATHAASVSPIDEEKIFYLESRGIQREEAKRMVTMGFFDPLVLGIKSDEIRAKMRYMVETKWRGHAAESFDEKMLKEFMTEDAIKSGDAFEGHYKYR